jgi:hypothetical protein
MLPIFILASDPLEGKVTFEKNQKMPKGEKGA